MANNTALIAGGVGCALIGLCCVCGAGAYFVTQSGEYAFPMPPAVQTPTNTPPVAPPPGTTDAPVPAGANEQEVRGPGYAYNVPASWVASSAAGLVQMHGSKEFPGRTVNLASEDFAGPPSEYQAATVRGLQTQSQATIVGQRPATVGTQPAFEIESDWVQGAVRVHLIQLGTARNGKGFVLTCGDLAERFAAAEPECRAILASFRTL